MIYIAINVIFNSFILYCVMNLGQVFGVLSHTPIWILWLAAFIISAVLTLIGYTRFATAMVGIFVPGRKMIGREKIKLEPLFSEVIKNTNAKYATSYKLEDFNIKVSDDKTTNAFALGYDTIVVNRGAFDSLNDEQLSAILAHEMGHLFYRDSVRSIALIFSSFATRIVMCLYAVYLVIASAFAEAKNSISLIGLIPLLLFLPVIAFNWLGSKVFYLLNMRMSRGAEYRADEFAASLGYKAEMISALEIIDSDTVTNNSFINKIMSTHPAPMQRIGALEDGEVARGKIGNLLVATPFATNSNNVSGNSEIMRLFIVLLIAGILWFALVIKDVINDTMIKEKSPFNYKSAKF